MNKAKRAEIEERIWRAYSLGGASMAYRAGAPHEALEPLKRHSADLAAFGAGQDAQLAEPSTDTTRADAGALILKLVRWHDAGTRISWCHFTWNWWTGCVKVSSGCKHCYAEGWAKRTGRPIWGRKAERPISKGWEAKLRSWRRMADDPMWRHEFGLKPGERVRIFCGSLMDWAEGRADQRAAVARAFELIKANPWADCLLLTKRPQNVRGLLPADWGGGYSNVWLGTSIESGEPGVKDAELQAPVIARAYHLLTVPARVHFCSYEPAIGPLDLTPYLRVDHGRHAFDWVIYGGESGGKFRPEGTPEDPKLWAREMRDACRETGTAFFHKQDAHRFNERGVELDGEVIHEYPTPAV